jgi:ABC-type dipeptide/oligopeptide/nickel transport system permease subunit
MEGEKSKFEIIMESNSALQRFVKNKLAMSGFIFIFLMVLVSVFGSLIRLDKTENANDQKLNLALCKPGFSVNFISKKFDENEWIPVSKIEKVGDSIRVELFEKNGGGETVSFAISELKIDSEGQFISEKKFWLGTDKYGRDVLSRLMAGASISLLVGTIAVIISLLLGVTLGLWAGYFKGWIDAVISYFIQVVWAIPTLLLVMAICFAFGTGFWKVFVAVGLTMWVEVARITRGQVLGVREKEYIEAAKAVGNSSSRIIFRHVLPNVLSPIIVMSAANFASAILMEAGLSFLGLGAQIPTPSWGNMIRESYSYLTTDMAYLAFLPGVCIMLLVLSFMMVGNGLRDALDVREN